jgi:ketosteroid isomerase-like protein
MGKTIVAALVAALGAACAQQSEVQFGQQEAARIRQRTQEYAQAFNAKDSEKVLSFYSGETVFMPPNATTVRGREAVGDFHKQLYSEGAEQLVLESKGVGGHGTLAYESGTFTLQHRPANGPETRDRGKYMLIWRFYRPQNAWMMEYTMWSSDLPQRLSTEAAN